MKYFSLSGTIALVLFIITGHTVHAQNIQYQDGKNSWNADSLGNHRFVIQLTPDKYKLNQQVAKVSIPWRRADKEPGSKRIIIASEKNNTLVQNILTVNISAENGEILFEPIHGAGRYYVYYLPYKNEGRSNYPKGVYLKPVTSNSNWQTIAGAATKFATASVTAYQSIDDFNSFYPMSFIATAAETGKLKAAAKKKAYIVFPEDRMFPVKMQDQIPYRWAQKGQQYKFSGKADKGEWYSYQLAIWAQTNLENVQVSFSDLKSATNQTIKASAISCLNTDGTNYKAEPLTKQVNVTAGMIQPMWCMVKVPDNISAGTYTGTATVIVASQASTTIQVQLQVSNNLSVEGGIGQPEKQTRLHWLNSTLAQENTVIAPYTPLQVTDTTISLLGRKLLIAKDGFPAQLQSFFTPEMTSIGKQAYNLLAEPMHFHFTAGKQKINWQQSGVKFTTQEPGTVSWQANNTTTNLTMQVNGSLEFDGFLSYQVKLTALEDITLNDINFHIPVLPQHAKYVMGLGLKGGNRPDSVLWKWDVANKNQDGAWLGDVNVGVQFSLRDQHYVRPLNTNFYLQKPLLLPESWGNGNKGGIDIFKKGSSVLVNAYSGERTMKKGEELYYNFTLLLTPFHALNTEEQWANRFYHRYKEIDTIKAAGATVVNIHHANAINPWINYPFIEWKKMKAYIDEAHQKGLKVKIYNTVRELSNKAYETFPLRSLGHEIYSPGKGGGFSWLQEHVKDDYIAAWFVPEIKDAAIINSGMSRWHNYYVEGMNWLTQKVGIDGIYLDDVAFDRITMKRIKRVLTQNKKPGIIDLHSANQYNKSDGFNNSANLYMEHFPYINRLWFGEYFDYEKSNPDFFLTEVSGIPFGLMGEMLEGGGNPWRGMIYGMTNRLPWSDNADPRPIWKLWDQFGIQHTDMIGYWSPNCPVKTSNDKVLATVYKKAGTTLISIASWATENTDVQLQINWQALGLDPAKAILYAPAVTNFQPEKTFAPGDAIPVEKNKGWLLIVKNK
jgi:hypothetical protein